MLLERVVGVLVFVGLFVAFGLMSRRMTGGCHDCGGACAGEGGTSSCAGPSCGVEPEHSDEKNPAGWWG